MSIKIKIHVTRYNNPVEFVNVLTLMGFRQEGYDTRVKEITCKDGIHAVELGHYWKQTLKDLFGPNTRNELRIFVTGTRESLYGGKDEVGNGDAFLDAMRSGKMTFVDVDGITRYPPYIEIALDYDDEIPHHWRQLKIIGFKKLYEGRAIKRLHVYDGEMIGDYVSMAVAITSKDADVNYVYTYSTQLENLKLN